MADSILVNLHCHSDFSDGEQPPEILAANLAAAGVRCAALTDHDTVEGLPNFQDALRRRGVAYIPGVELTTQFNGREAHLLGYGFDPDHPELAATLNSLRQVRRVEVHSITGSIRKSGNWSLSGRGDFSSTHAAPNGFLEIEEAIALIHRAGGHAFWAHPLQFESDIEVLDKLIGSLKSEGLDGIEVVYDSNHEMEQIHLRSSAARHELLVCYGTDFHSSNDQGNNIYGMEMPRKDWIRFRDVIISNPKFTDSEIDSDPPDNIIPSPHPTPAVNKTHFRRRSYVLRIFNTHVYGNIPLSGFHLGVHPAFF